MGDGRLVISLDFELLWGVRDHADRATYGKNVLGAREAVPRILHLFYEHGVRATWATVGFLFCKSKEELLSLAPRERPQYDDRRLSNYNYLDEVGENEAVDPYYFAPSLIRSIAQTPGQEIGTHTFSHFYCLERGPSVQDFEADLAAAQKVAAARGIALTSIVFPRNQFSAVHLAACSRAGISHYRGNPTGWAYRAENGAKQTMVRRGLRLLDAYTGILEGRSGVNRNSNPTNVPASRFLRPCGGGLASLQPLHTSTILRGMTKAARSGGIYHLWWHPHNFGADIDANMKHLETIIVHFCKLRDLYGMKSCAMRDA